MKPQRAAPILHDTYLAVIRNSAGSRLFRNFYARVYGKKVDIMKHGALSCAFFVSSVLSLFKLIKQPHGTVDGAVRDLKQSGWKKANKPRIGSVLIWEKKKFRDGIHGHVGFYVGKNKAISNNSKTGSPAIHHWTFGMKNGEPVRKIEAIFWNKKLEQK